jgi:phage repressor protein C with HTH and peptisase S24 domain
VRSALRGWGGRVRAAVGGWGAVLVSGDSMRPTLRPNDACLVRYGARIEPGMVVVAQLPGRPLGIKRAALHDDADGWWLESDDPLNGTDSATFGFVPDAQVLGRVVLRYWPRPTWLGAGGRPSSARSRS